MSLADVELPNQVRFTQYVFRMRRCYVDDGEDSVTAAAREVEEETGRRPRKTEFVMSCQPLIGNADYPQDLCLASGAERVGEPEVDETAEVRWVPVDEMPAMIARGDILGATTIIGVQQVRLRRAAARAPGLAAIDFGICRWAGLVRGCGCLAYLMPTTIESGPGSGSA